MLGINNVNLIKRGIDTWGLGMQKLKTIEELGELQKEILRDLEGHCRREHIIEELADVEIMLFTLKYIFDVTEDELAYWTNFKLNRFEKIIKEEK